MMAKKKSKYAQDVSNVVNEFFGSIKEAMKWVEQNGLYEEARLYLLDMENAKNRTDFNKAKLAFKKNIVRPFYDNVIAPTDENVRQAFLKANPIMNFMSPKGLGSYDEIKKNEKVQNSKYAQINEDGSVSVPLLRMIDDPGELSDLAQALEVDAEDLRDHIINEWNLKKTREWVKEEAAMRKATIDGGKVNGVKFPGRKGVLKEFDKNFWSGVLRTVAPELYAGMRRDIAEGKGDAGSVVGWLGEHKKDAAIDAARNMALAMTGYAASPLATAGLVGATELSSLAASDYYDMNARNVGAALAGATFAGTVPGLVTRYAAPLLKSGNKAIRNAARDILRRIRNGEGTAAEVEQASLNEIVDDASKIVRSRVAGNETLTSEDVRNAVNAVYQKVISSPRIAFADGTRITQADIEKALLTEDGVNLVKGFLSAPSKKTWVEWNKMSNNPAYGYEQRIVLQDAMKRAENMFPEAVKEIKYISGNGKALNSVIATGAKVVNTVGSKAEPMIARNVYEEGLSSYEADHPEQVESWKRYGIPDWDPLADEFNEKYGKGK